MTSFSTLTRVAAVGTAALAALAASPALAQSDFFFTADNGTTNRRSPNPPPLQGGDGTVITSLPTPVADDAQRPRRHRHHWWHAVLQRLRPRHDLLRALHRWRPDGLRRPLVARQLQRLRYRRLAAASKFWFGDGVTNAIYTADGSAWSQLSISTRPSATAATTPAASRSDETGGKVYWTDTTTDVVYRANTDGTAAELLFSTTRVHYDQRYPQRHHARLAGNRLFVGDNDDFIATAATSMAATLAPRRSRCIGVSQRRWVRRQLHARRHRVLRRPPLRGGLVQWRLFLRRRHRRRQLRASRCPTT